VDFSSDDEFSDFTNQVIVTGRERSNIEVLHAEEMVGTLNGTLGWWGCKQTFDVHYSPDHSRKCRYPRLNILESATSLGFKLAQLVYYSPMVMPATLLGLLKPNTTLLTESITFISADETYCTITVTVPNLIPALIVAISEWAFAHFVFDFAAVYVTIPFGRLIEATWMFITMQIISAMANFQYEIWARPIGTTKRSVQGQADDADLQAEIGDTITQKLEDPLCYSAGDCTFVAQQEIMVHKLQRKRVTFSKIADFRDEVGDTIQINHPYTGAAMKVFITDLKRTMVISSPSDSGSNEVPTDSIQGWVL
jgi:hypothetical protein